MTSSPKSLKLPKLNAIRGFNDIMMDQMPTWQYLTDVLRSLMHQYGYEQIILPIVEHASLFHRGVGEQTDIVQKETYDFEDRNGDHLTLRPEGTAGCVRAMIEHGLLRGATPKVWYLGPMFRHERPQKGRYRQFYQFGLEVFGIPEIHIEAEILLLCWRLWQKLQLSDHIHLELNYLGSIEQRQRYIAALSAFLEGHMMALDEDSQRRLKTNPLRILDSKDEKTQAIISKAPKLWDYIDPENQKIFHELCAFLEEMKIPFTVNPYLVRGLDYYSATVFEWKTELLGAQSAVCAGGRYDVLVSRLGGPADSFSVGFALGMERLVLLLEHLHLKNAPNYSKIYMISQNAACLCKSLKLAEEIRTAFPSVIVEVNTGLGSLKSQFKKADKAQAEIALILGEEELLNATCAVKYLRRNTPQEFVQQDLMVSHLSRDIL